MKTAIELADEFPEQNLANIEPDAANILNWWGIEAVAMLCQQAEQIEALTKERDGAYVQSLQFSEENEALLKANLDCVDHFNTLKTDYDALKADAERYQWYVAQLESGNLDKLEEAFRNMERVEIVTKQMFDAAIDAMKGAT